jgi:hypothetical protein
MKGDISMKFLKATLAAALALAATTQANAITYTSTRTVGTGTANLSITTDDTIGLLSTANITSFTITVANSFGSFTINEDNGEAQIVGSALSATATNLLFDFTGEGGSYALFQAPTIGSAQTFYCLEVTVCANNPNGETLLPDNNYNEHRSFANYSGQQVIASADGAAVVPEPATWGMMLLGFGLVGAGMRRRNTEAATA